METSQLIEKAQALYAKLGCVGSPDARLIRGMIKKLEDLQAEVQRLKQFSAGRLERIFDKSSKS